MFNPIQTFLSSITGKVIAFLALVILALVVLLYVDHARYTVELAGKNVVIAKKNESITNLQAQLLQSQKDLKDAIAINEINDSAIQELQQQIVVNTHICTDQVSKLKKDLDKMRTINTDLRNYSRENPDSFLNYRIPDEVIDITNGKVK